MLPGGLRQVSMTKPVLSERKPALSVVEGSNGLALGAEPARNTKLANSV